MSSTTTTPNAPAPLLPGYIPSPFLTRLIGKRVILASSSPRRHEIFENQLRLKAEIVPSTFAEDLSKAGYVDDPSLPPGPRTVKGSSVEDDEENEAEGSDPSARPAVTGAAAYPLDTATEKGLEVYERLVKEANERESEGVLPPSLVIAADTVVINNGEILEKPGTKEENLRMLLDLNGGTNRVVTAVVTGE